MVKIIFRDSEFKPIDEYIAEPNFAVSITANTKGFLPARSWIKAYRLNLELIQNVEDKCNLSKECIVIENLIPKIILVPHTKGKDSQNIIDNFLNIINFNNIELVHFTHYSWLLSFPENEVKMLLTKLNDPKIITTLKKIIIDTPNVILFEGLLKKITLS